MKPLYYDLPNNLDADKRTHAKIGDDVYPDEINEDSYPFFPLRKYLNYIKSSNNDLVLEAGCGPGRVLRYLESKGIKTIGIDIDFESLKKVNCKKNNSKHISVVNCDIRYLPFKKNMFKIIMLFGVIGLLRNKETQKELIRDLNNYLKTDGLMIISFTRQNGIYSCMHNLRMNNFLRRIFFKPKIDKYFGIWSYKKTEAIELLKKCRLKPVGFYYVMKKFSLYEFILFRKTFKKIQTRKGDESLEFNFLGKLFFTLLNNKHTESLISSGFVIVCSRDSLECEN